MKGKTSPGRSGLVSWEELCFFRVSWRRPLKSRPSFPPRQPRALTFASLAAHCLCFCHTVENWPSQLKRLAYACNCSMWEFKDQEFKALFGYISWSSTSVTWDLGSKTKPKCPTGITSSLSPEFFQFPRWPDYSLMLWVALMFPRRHWKCLKIIIHDASFNLYSAERPVSTASSASPEAQLPWPPGLFPRQLWERKDMWPLILVSLEGERWVVGKNIRQARSEELLFFIVFWEVQWQRLNSKTICTGNGNKVQENSYLH